MTIEIHQPELEALIIEHMAAGGFQNPEDLLKVLLNPANTDVPPRAPERRTGRALLEAMQACPHPEIDIEPSQTVMSPSEPVSL